MHLYTACHVMTHDTTLCILLGAYFPSNSLCSNDGKYTLYSIELRIDDVVVVQKISNFCKGLTSLEAVNCTVCQECFIYYNCELSFSSCACMLASTNAHLAKLTGKSYKYKFNNYMHLFKLMLQTHI